MKGKMKNKFYVTTAIMYVNAKPHLGYALEVVQGDVLKRYYKKIGLDSYFLTGTDEHGIKMQTTAEEAKTNPAKLAAENTKKTIELARSLNSSFDDFIKTSDKKRHWPAVQKLWKKLEKNGDIEKKKYKAFYCVGCEGFLSKSDLVDGKCPYHGKEPELVEEENWFFKLSKYQERLKKIIETDELKIIPESRKNEVLSFLNQGLDDVSFSRESKKLYWGIPVPGDDSQTIYVWCDALTNYISAIDYEKEGAKFKKYWPADLHIIGKDILRFHALYWPAMLLSAGVKLPKSILVHGFINSGGKKMSKSLGNVIDPKEIIDKYGAEALRYYLLRYIPTKEDGDFTIQHFEKVYSSDLANGLGNLLQRTLSMVDKYKVSVKNNKPKQLEKSQKKLIENFEFDKRLENVWSIIKECDKFIDDEKPWELAKNNQKKLKEVLQKVYDALTNIADEIDVFMPETSEKMKKQLKNLKPEPLFPRLGEK